MVFARMFVGTLFYFIVIACVSFAIVCVSFAIVKVILRMKSAKVSPSVESDDPIQAGVN